jgi:carbon storage regulator
MLILRRKVGEKIVIGDGIVVVVTRVSGARVTLGIEAPAAVHIVRGELRAFDEADDASKIAVPAPIEMHSATGSAMASTAVPHLPR